jgi:hypothetical protein
MSIQSHLSTRPPITTTATFPETTPSSLLALLHLPELLIQLNPLVDTFHRIKSSKAVLSSSSDFRVRYAITDQIPLLGGLWSTRTSYTASFTPSLEGMHVDIQAAMGVTTKSIWSVKSVEEGLGSEVTEESEVIIAGGAVWDWLLRGYIEVQIKNSHGVLMGRLRDKVARWSEDRNETRRVC